jgi:two-component system, LuxR family, response regulator FixJ
MPISVDDGLAATPHAVPAMAAQAANAANAINATNAADPASGTDDDPRVQDWQARLLRLTPREMELLRWVIEDKLNKTIADLMGISIKTVELHRKRVMNKLGATSATQLMRMWVSGRVA